ncbi:MAG: hypothetical protein ABIF87_07870 [Pseudomonadota bacterium]
MTQVNSRQLCILLCIVVISSFMSGCIIMPAGIADSTTPINDNDKVTKLGPTEGEAYSVLILGILPVAEGGTATAVERAKKCKGADALTDVTLDNRVCLCPVAYIYQTKVQGEAVKIEKGAAQ